MLCDRHFGGFGAVPTVIAVLQRIYVVKAVSHDAAHSFSHAIIVSLHVCSIVHTTFTVLQTVGRIACAIEQDIVERVLTEIIQIVGTEITVDAYRAVTRNCLIAER